MVLRNRNIGVLDCAARSISLFREGASEALPSVPGRWIGQGDLNVTREDLVFERTKMKNSILLFYPCALIDRKSRITNIGCYLIVSWRFSPARISWTNLRQVCPVILVVGTRVYM